MSWGNVTCNPTVLLKNTSQKDRGHFSIMTVTHLPLLLDVAGEAE
jgi:hypothetical protein